MGGGVSLTDEEGSISKKKMRSDGRLKKYMFYTVFGDESISLHHLKNISP